LFFFFLNEEFNYFGIAQRSLTVFDREWNERQKEN